MSSILAFEKFYTEWLEDLKLLFRDFRPLIKEHSSRSLHPPAASGGEEENDADNTALISEMVRDVHSRYKKYVEEKMKICREDASFVFAGMWRSPLEASFNWMGGWRPTTSIVLAYSLMGMHIEDELLRLIHGIELPTMAALSASQLSALHSLQQNLSVAEDSLCNRIAVVQMLLPDHHMTKAAASSPPPSESNDFSFVQEAIEPKLASLSDLLLDAEELRGNTLQELLNIFTPIQSGQYALAAYEMAMAIQKLGIQREDAISGNSLTSTNVREFASQGDAINLQKALECILDPSEPDYDGRTSLHLAAGNGHAECVSLLIQKGADVNKKDNFGITPLFEALRAGHDSVIQVLVESGAKTHLEDEGTELCKAVATGDTSYMERLIKHGVGPNVSDYGDRTPLHIAAREGDLQMTTFLVNNGASVFAKDRHGLTPLDAARMSQDKATIQLLESKVPNRKPVENGIELEQSLQSSQNRDVDTKIRGLGRVH